MIWDTCVKTYLALIQNGCPEEWRPTRCRRCDAESKFHRHGHYTRMLYTLEEALEIIIYRFRCTTCRKTFGLLPPFLTPHRTAALDVQEQVVRELDGGTPLRKVAEGLVLPTQPYSEKSLWRWKKDWDRLWKAVEPSFWSTVLAWFPHLRLPRGSGSPRTGWGWLFWVWERVRAQLTDRPDTGCLQWLSHLARLMAVAG